MQHTSLLQVPQLQSNLLKATELLPFLVLSFYTTLMQTFQNEKGSDHVLFLHKDYFPPPPSPHPSPLTNWIHFIGGSECSQGTFFLSFF